MKDDLIEYWIWLQQALGANSPKPEKLMNDFGSIGGIYEARRVDYINTGFLSEKEIRRLCDKSLEKSKEIVGHCMEKGYKMLAPQDMPQRLRGIYAPPCVLYVWGELPQPTDGVYIAMVGTRGVTPYGVEAATKLAAGLAHCGAVVVSGMAVGVDAASHKGALKGGGKTVAVIGCGIDIDYPAPHRELKRLIAQNGAVVSEYPPGARPDRINFPVRNRIIAGLSLGCVVVEAGSRSGALITASLATEMGRDVFAVPGSIFSAASEGPNKLLRDGAKPVCNVLDILEEYIGLCPQSIIAHMTEENGDEKPSQLSFDNITKKQSSQKQHGATKVIERTNENLPDATSDGKITASKTATCPTAAGAELLNNKLPDATAKEKVTASKTAACPGAAGAEIPNENLPDAAAKGKVTASKTANCPGAAGLSERQRMVLEVLTGEPQHVDDISLKANLELRTVLAVLTTLEIEGYAQSYPGRRYTAMR